MMLLAFNILTGAIALLLCWLFASAVGPGGSPTGYGMACVTAGLLAGMVAGNAAYRIAVHEGEAPRSFMMWRAQRRFRKAIRARAAFYMAAGVDPRRASQQAELEVDREAADMLRELAS